MNKGRARLFTWLILGGLLLGMSGCGSLGAGRTTNAAPRATSNGALKATQALDNSHKNYNSPIP